MIISYSGETRDTVDAAEIAKEAGATTICITNFPRSSLARLCDVSLVTSSTKMRWLEEAVTVRIAQLALLDALCAAICRKQEMESPEE